MGEWIKCSEQMPDYFVDVLVSDGGNVEVMWRNCYGLWGCCVDGDDRKVCPDDVTHWMPLPEPPEV